MNESLYTKLSDQELLSLILKIIDEHMLLIRNTSSQRAIEEKRNELLKVYNIIKERGLGFDHPKTDQVVI